MMHIGIDIEQFVTDPYGSGIQRVLQYLAKEWPKDMATAEFVVPYRDMFLLLSPEQATDLIGEAFDVVPNVDIRTRVNERVERYADSVPLVRSGQLMAMFSAWLLPEVSYLPSVLDRFERFQQAVPAVMIGYDALPMTEPANYRFTPGRAGEVSRYFRYLAQADSVICISEYARNAILERLRRDRRLPISVSYPGGDHITAERERSAAQTGSIRFMRLGTLEARKRPRDIVDAAELAIRLGASIELTFVGAPSASNAELNAHIAEVASREPGITWISDADDVQVLAELQASDVFLSFGTEGFGIPVLEANALGIPVLFDGIQPAAEIMNGHGALRVTGDSVEELAAVLVEYSNRSRVSELALSIDVDYLPTWRAFTEGVVAGVLTV